MIQRAFLCGAILLTGGYSQEVWTKRYSSPSATTVSVMGGKPGLYLAITSTVVSATPDIKHQAFRSVDGFIWSPTILPKTKFIASDGDRIIGVGLDGVWTSTDGLSSEWAFHGPLDPTGIAQGNGCWVVVSRNGTILRAENPTGPWVNQVSQASTMLGIAFGDGIFLSCSGANETIKSSDGISWVPVPTLSPTFEILGFANGIFHCNQTSTPDQGKTWNIKGPTTSPGIEQLLIGPGVFLARNNTNQVYTSTTDFTFPWTAISTGLGSQVTVTSIGYAGNLWLAAGSDGQIITSPDTHAPPVSVPSITINPAVELTWDSVVGRYYQVQVSVDNVNWADIGLPSLGNGSLLKFNAPAKENRKFFRVVVH